MFSFKGKLDILLLVVDVVQALTDQTDNTTARKYWNKLAQRLRDEGGEVVTNCHRLKLKASDNKLRETDCSNTEGIFRIIQSTPSYRRNLQGHVWHDAK